MANLSQPDLPPNVENTSNRPPTFEYEPKELPVKMERAIYLHWNPSAPAKKSYLDYIGWNAACDKGKFGWLRWWFRFVTKFVTVLSIVSSAYAFGSFYPTKDNKHAWQPSLLAGVLHPFVEFLIRVVSCYWDWIDYEEDDVLDKKNCDTLATCGTALIARCGALEERIQAMEKLLEDNMKRCREDSKKAKDDYRKLQRTHKTELRHELGEQWKRQENNCKVRLEEEERRWLQERTDALDVLKEKYEEKLRDKDEKIQATKENCESFLKDKEKGYEAQIEILKEASRQALINARPNFRRDNIRTE